MGKETVAILIALMLITGCESSTGTEEEPTPEPKEEISFTYRMLTFSGDKQIRAYAEDTLVVSATESGRWEYTTTLHVGDTVSTEITFPETHYGQTKILYTSGQDTIGSECNFFGSAPSGHKFECGFKILPTHAN
jgi:hypothetical protein